MLLLALVSGGEGDTVCFFEPLGKIEFHGRVIYTSEGFVNVGLQLHGRDTGMFSTILSGGRNRQTWSGETVEAQMRKSDSIRIFCWTLSPDSENTY